MNEGKLKRQFYVYTGMGVLAYLKLARLEKAKELLGQTNRSMKFIATPCGYSAARTFIRAFKKLYGVTQLRYRSKGLYIDK